MKFLIMTILLLTISISNVLGSAVFLKSGKIVEGSILREGIKAIIVQQKDKNQVTVNRNTIMRIVYKTIFLGKQHLRLNDGRTISGYIVEEARSYIVFRASLYKPVEKRIKRSDIMFITRSNPTNLKGRPDATSITLTWKPPFVKPVGYIIYMKKTDVKVPYKKVGRTGATIFTIFNLNKKTKYSFYVKGLDVSGKESLPSNKIDVVTNIPPTIPGYDNLKIKNSGEKKVTVTLTWDKSNDADGSVKKYNIYQKYSTRSELLGTSDTKSYEIKNLRADKDYIFEVRAVDNQKVESDPLVLGTYERSGLYVGGRGYYSLTFGAMNDVLTNGQGYGGTIQLRDIIYSMNWGLDIGIDGGYVTYDGNNETVQYAYMAPILLRGDFRYFIFRNFTVGCSIAGGVQYSGINYDPDGDEDNGLDFETKKGYGSLAVAGVLFSYSIANRIPLIVRFDYGMIIESEIMMFANISAGVGVRLSLFSRH